MYFIENIGMFFCNTMYRIEYSNNSNEIKGCRKQRILGFSMLLILGVLMVHPSQKRSCLYATVWFCVCVCVCMCVIFPGCMSSVFVFLVIRVPDSGSGGSALQYLVPPKPTIVPAGIQPSHSSLWSLTWCHANLFSWRSEPNVTKCICRNIDLWCWVFEQTGRKSI